MRNKFKILYIILLFLLISIVSGFLSHYSGENRGFVLVEISCIIIMIGISFMYIYYFPRE